MARWKPKRQEAYYFINEYGKVKGYYWWNEEEDNKLYTIGNCFQTKEDAEIALEMVKELLSSLHGENEKTKTYKCKNCKSTNTELLKTKPWQYYICKNCNMIYQTEESKREERKLEKEKAK